MAEPRTLAGRTMHDDRHVSQDCPALTWDGKPTGEKCQWLNDILAIEREATAGGPAVALRGWLLDQSRQAHEQANILPGDPAHAWDAGAAHMADATLTRLSTLIESSSDDRAEGDIAAYAAWRRDPQRVTADDHDINCGIDALRLGEDIGCTCGAERDGQVILASALAALTKIEHQAFDTNDECRYCAADFEEPHEDRCPLVIIAKVMGGSE